MDDELEARFRALELVAQESGWAKHQLDSEKRRAEMNYNLECLDVLAATYHLDPKNVEDCRRAIREKFAG